VKGWEHQNQYESQICIREGGKKEMWEVREGEISTFGAKNCLERKKV